MELREKEKVLKLLCLGKFNSHNEHGQMKDPRLMHQQYHHQDIKMSEFQQGTGRNIC